jgi:hypothetical protein
MKFAVRFLLVISALLMLNSPALAQSRVPPERATAARQALVAWFECVECTDFELEKLLRYRHEVEGALAHVLLEGPSPAVLAQIEQEVRDQSDANAWPSREKEDFVRMSVGNTDSAYRLRAITALVRLKTPAARAALTTAAGGHVALRQDVREAARKALSQLPP